MQGSLILRLVDVVLLLLLSLMASSSIHLYDVDPPVSQGEEVGSGRLHPLQIAIAPDGHFLVVDGQAEGRVRTLMLHELHDIARQLEPGRVIEFIADRQSAARLLIEANRAVQAAGREAVFLVERNPDAL